MVRTVLLAAPKIASMLRNNLLTVTGFQKLFDQQRKQLKMGDAEHDNGQITE